jgi:ATP-dependent DNA ligase
MNLPVNPPVSPMLAKLVREMPAGPGLSYEPKWDGFRCIVFRDGDEVELGSRNERPLTRYFPEVVEALVQQLPRRCVLDGEVVIAGPDGLDFEALLQRIHPADSRVRMLSEATPASFVAFDLLGLDDRDYRSAPYEERRAALEAALSSVAPPVYVTPVTRDVAKAADWFDRFEGAGLDGVIVKPLDLRYREGERVMWKVKHERTADCVVVGFRWHKDGAGVGSLLLGLYDDEGTLHHLGVASGFSAALRKSLVAELEPYRSEGPGAGVPSADRAWQGPVGHRWNAGRDMSFVPLREELVCEVRYDHLQGQRFRHATSFVRWRPDRQPASCTYQQLDVAVPEELEAVFGAR